MYEHIKPCKYFTRLISFKLLRTIQWTLLSLGDRKIKNVAAFLYVCTDNFYIYMCMYTCTQDSRSHLLCTKLSHSGLNFSESFQQPTNKLKDQAAEEILKTNPQGHHHLGLLPMISNIQFLSWSLIQLPLKSVGISPSTSVGAGSVFPHFPLGLARDENVRDAAWRAPDGRK